MIQDEEQLLPDVHTSSAAAENTNAEVSATPHRPFRFTVEFPMFICILTASLSG